MPALFGGDARSRSSATDGSTSLRSCAADTAGGLCSSILVRGPVLAVDEPVSSTSRGGLAFGGLFVVAGALAIALTLSEPLRTTITSLVLWVRGAGPLGGVAFVTMFVVATVLLVPGSLLSLSAGVAYGVVTGSVITVVAGTLAMSAPFAIGRRILRPLVVHRLTGRPRLAAIDRAVERDGAKIVVLLRLSPVVPYNLLNYALSATRLRFPSYLAASVLGFTPGAVLTVYLGAAVSRASELGSTSDDPATSLLFWGGLVATIAASLVITHVARSALATMVEVPASATVDHSRNAVVARDERTRS
jgi:uncharacterized membrane protein YdjX (TVP38/TMEM64 family)